MMTEVRRKAERQHLDEPIRDPRADLLGTAIYAKNLARHTISLPWPFTIGVYGEWGEGKTSFVHLTRHYLESEMGRENVEFINFSAWPYTTAGAIWRALGCRLASRIYQFDERMPSEPLPPKAPEVGLLPSIRQFLGQDALTIRKPGVDPRRREFDTVVQSLDSSASLVTGRGQYVPGDGAILKGLSQLVLNAATPFAPWLSKLGNLDLGLSSSSGDESATPAVALVEQTKHLLKQMFDRLDDGRRVVLFIDDLDRCLPEVALEVLEALKIFLDAAPCLFIVAADESLIGTGLRARFHKSAGSEGEPSQLSSEKGKQYFEKIIQFGIPVPPRSAEQAKTFVACQFPEWASCSDLLEVTAGTNPRRLNQSCNLLSYQFAVAMDLRPMEGGGTSLAPDDARLLEKLIRCNALCPGLLPGLCTAIEKVSDADQLIYALEEHARLLSGDRPTSGDRPAYPLKDNDKEVLFSLLETAPLVCRILNQPPRLSESNFERVLELAEFVNTQSARYEAFWRCSDRTLLRFLEEISQPGGLDSVATVIRLDLTRILEVDEELEGALSLLRPLAEQGTHSWTRATWDIEAWLESGDEKKLQAFDSADRREWVTLLEMDSQRTETVDGIGLELHEAPRMERLLLGREPRLSSIHPLVVRAYCAIRQGLPEVNDLLNSEISPGATPAESLRSMVAEAGIKLLRSEHGQLYEELEDILKLRQQAAVYFWEHRKFAKLGVLARGWPALAHERLLEGNSEIRRLEELMRSPKNELPARWRPFQEDHRLRKLMRLRPHFSEIDWGIREEFLAVAEPWSQSTQAGDPSGMEPAAIDGGHHVKAEVFSAPTSTPPTPPTSRAEETYLPFDLEIRSSQEMRESHSLLLVRAPGLEMSGSIPMPDDRLRDLSSKFRNNLSDFFRHELTDSRERLDPAIAEDRMRRIKDLGIEIFVGIFGELGEAKPLQWISEQLSEDRRLRLTLSLEGAWVNLPWEALFFPKPVEVFPSLHRSLSVVRSLPGQTMLPTPRLSSTVRILVVTPSPADLPPLGSDKEARILESSLGPAKVSHRIHIKAMDGRPTIRALHRQVRKFRPHIFHFVGHGLVLPDGGGGALVFENEDGQADVMGVEGLKTLLTQSSIVLAVLNGCETGISGANNSLTSVAGALVTDGIPTAIATIRPITDQTAFLFTREFYGALAEGLPLEEALVESRRALQLSGADWTAYALFSSSTDLQSIRFGTRYRSSTDSDPEVS